MRETDKQHSIIEKLDLQQLADRLAELDQERTPVGWEPRHAVVRSAIERRIMELVSGEPPDEERRQGLRLPCKLKVRVKVEDHKPFDAVARDLGAGGIFLETRKDLARGTPVELVVRGQKGEHGFKVHGEVTWLARGKKDTGVGVSFRSRGEGEERRLRRFVLELLRHRTHD